MCNSKQSKLAFYCSYRKRHKLFDVTLTDIFRIIVNTLIMKISIEEIRGKNSWKRSNENKPMIYNYFIIYRILAFQ